MQLAYVKYHTEISRLVEDTRSVIVKDDFSSKEEMLEKIDRVAQRLGRDDRLRIALIGEYSAGKSSLISALTDQELYIDADVATQETKDYEWHGHLLTDTPGIQAEDTETDHDRIAREATLGADIVLFIVTNELFTPRLAKHLHYVLDEDKLGLAKKTAVIVNKMDREINPDVIIANAVSEVLGPHKDVPILLCSAGKHLEAQTVGNSLKERFTRQGRISSLVDELDMFLDGAGKTGQLTTPLQIITEVLDMLQADLLEKESDRKCLELVRRKRVTLERLQKELTIICRACKDEVYAAVIQQAEPVLQEVTPISENEDIVEYYATGLKSAEPDVERIYGNACSDIQDKFRIAREELDEIGESNLAQAVLKESVFVSDKADMDFSKKRPKDGLLVFKAAREAFKPLGKGLEEAAKNTRVLHKEILKVGHALGKKFKPHEAIKASGKVARNMKNLGKSAPYLAAGLDFYIQYKEEQNKEKLERYLASMRRSVRNAFIEQARLQSRNVENTLRSNYKEALESAFKTLEKETNSITSGQNTKKEHLQTITAIKQRINTVRNTLYSGDR